MSLAFNLKLDDCINPNAFLALYLSCTLLFPHCWLMLYQCLILWHWKLGSIWEANLLFILLMLWLVRVCACGCNNCLWHQKHEFLMFFAFIIIIAFQLSWRLHPWEALCLKLFLNDSDENEIIKEVVMGSTSQCIRHRYIRRNHLASNVRLFLDYFAPSPVFPPTLFCRRFQMRCFLFSPYSI